MLLLYSGLNAVFNLYKIVANDRNTRDQLVWTAGNGDPTHGVCTPHTCEAREEADTRIIVRERKEIWKEGTWGL